MEEHLFGKKHNMKCFGSTTVGERGQIVLPAEIRKQYNIEPGQKLIVMGSDYEGLQSMALMKSEDLAKMFEYITEMENMLKGKSKDIETFKKEGLKKLKAVKKSGIKKLEKKTKIKTGGN